MRKPKQPTHDFKTLLKKYIDIKGLDIVVILEDGRQIELSKNRALIDNTIVFEENKSEIHIPLSEIKSVDCFAA